MPQHENLLKIIRLTPAGRGAIASLLLTGPGAAEIFLKHWPGKNPLLPETLPKNKPVFGKILLTRYGQTEVSEEAVVHFISPDEVEIHCHGGTAVIESVQKVFFAEGAVNTDWLEHFCAGKDQRDLALRMLPFAETERVAQILLSQLNGALENELKEIETLPEDEKQQWIERLRKKESLGRHLIKPFSIVLAGEVNAGKSSLLNAILGFQRVITDSSPGTTRDIVSVKTAINGFMFEFSDTAGFRKHRKEHSSDLPDSNEEQQRKIEIEGIKRAKQLLETADLVLWIVDSVENNPHPPQIPETAKKVLVCCNKIDLPES
ncbi:MAG: 50S ribosome-binding GTPase, partial [Planctomycetaceae bacterium]|nr:50S ribosome-binding GTPase [Planctomycetaceae bacterium]